ADGRGVTRPLSPRRHRRRDRALSGGPSRLRLPAALVLRQAGRRAPLGAADRPLPPAARIDRIALPCALVVVILALADAGAEPGRQGRARRLQLGVVVERCLALPQLEQRKLVRIENALEDFELLTAAVFSGFFTARLERAGEFGAL